MIEILGTIIIILKVKLTGVEKFEQIVLKIKTVNFVLWSLTRLEIILVFFEHRKQWITY